MKILFMSLAASLTLLGPSAVGSPAAAQGLAHTFLMRGQVVEANAEGLVVCVGREDGAQAGQILDVIRISTNPGPRTTGFRRNKIGQVKIEQIFDAHFARATLVSGSAEKHDLVELRSSPK